jgi:apolipoprotein N-acyltransferase
MTETTSDIRSPAKREKLRRMALWALLGAVSGAGAWIVVWAVDGDELSIFVAPGLVFGLAAGLALHRLGHARLWQAALFAVLSVPAFS